MRSSRGGRVGSLAPLGASSSRACLSSPPSRPPVPSRGRSPLQAPNTLRSAPRYFKTPNFESLAGGNPYFNQRQVIDPKTYLGGGKNFGPVGPPPTPDIVTRNLTPDKTGRSEGGHTFEQFRQIIRTGKDFDRLHPNC